MQPPLSSKQDGLAFLRDRVAPFDWSQKKILGLGAACFDPQNVAHRFLTMVESQTITETVTE